MRLSGQELFRSAEIGCVCDDAMNSLVQHLFQLPPSVPSGTIEAGQMKLISQTPLQPVFQM